MATLHVRNVPDDVYEALRRRAEDRGTSISAEAVDLLGSALERSERKRAARELLDELRGDALRVPPGTPSPAELVRADRDAR